RHARGGILADGDLGDAGALVLRQVVGGHIAEVRALAEAGAELEVAARRRGDLAVGDLATRRAALARAAERLPLAPALVGTRGVAAPRLDGDGAGDAVAERAPAGGRAGVEHLG